MTTHHTSRLFIFLLQVALGVASWSMASETRGDQDAPIVRFSAPALEGTKMWKNFEKYMNALCNTAEIKGCELVSMPIPRASDEIKLGFTDVILGRRKESVNKIGLGELSRTLDYPIWNLGIVLYYTHNTEPMHKWQDLLASGGRIGYVRGITLVEERLSALGNSISPFTVTAVSQCLSMLLVQRADVCVGFNAPTDDTFVALLETGAIRKSEILEFIELYAVVTNKHPALYDKLNIASRKLHASGLDTQIQHDFSAFNK